MTEAHRPSPPTAARPDTIVLVHGLWMTPRSWEGWVEHYKAKGYQVVTPGYPGFEIEVEALRENPDDHRQPDRAGDRRPPGRRDRSPRDAADHHGPLVRRHPDPAAAGPRSRLAPAWSSTRHPPRASGSARCPRLRSLFPALKNPANRHKAVGFTPEEFHYAFTNTLSEEDSKAVWDRYAIAAPGNWVWAYGLIANFKPGHQETWVDYDARPGTVAVHRRREGPHHAAVGQQVERQALQEVTGPDRVPRVRGPRPLDLRRARLGGRRRLRARLGGEARQHRPSRSTSRGAVTRPAGSDQPSSVSNRSISASAAAKRFRTLGRPGSARPAPGTRSSSSIR